MLLAAPVARAPQGGALLGRDIRVLTRCWRWNPVVCGL